MKTKVIETEKEVYIAFYDKKAVNPTLEKTYGVNNLNTAYIPREIANEFNGDNKESVISVIYDENYSAEEILRLICSKESRKILLMLPIVLSKNNDAISALLEKTGYGLKIIPLPPKVVEFRDLFFVSKNNYFDNPPNLWTLIKENIREVICRLGLKIKPRFKLPRLTALRCTNKMVQDLFLKPKFFLN